MNEINTITDEIVLKEKYAEIFKIYDNDVPYIGLYYNHDTIAYSTDLMGDVKPNCYSIFYNFSNWYRELLSSPYAVLPMMIISNKNQYFFIIKLILLIL